MDPQFKSLISDMDAVDQARFLALRQLDQNGNGEKSNPFRRMRDKEKKNPHM
jgi:hypothetical protein